MLPYTRRWILADPGLTSEVLVVPPGTFVQDETLEPPTDHWAIEFILLDDGIVGSTPLRRGSVVRLFSVGDGTASIVSRSLDPVPVPEGRAVAGDFIYWGVGFSPASYQMSGTLLVGSQDPEGSLLK